MERYKFYIKIGYVDPKKSNMAAGIVHKRKSGDYRAIFQFVE